MKKLPILIVLIAFFAAQLTSAQRPTDQGKILIGLSSNSYSANITGSNNFFSTGINNTAINYTSSPKETRSNSTFSFAPKVGYFVVENLVMGTEISMGSSAIRKDSDFNKNKTSMAMIGPFIRYYFEQNSWFYPILECGISMGSIKYTTDYKDPQREDYNLKYKLSNIYGSAGIAFVLSEFFMADLKLNANYFNLDYPKNSFASDRKEQSFTIQVGLTGAF